MFFDRSNSSSLNVLVRFLEEAYDLEAALHARVKVEEDANLKVIKVIISSTINLSFHYYLFFLSHLVHLFHTDCYHRWKSMFVGGCMIPSP